MCGKPQEYLDSCAVFESKPMHDSCNNTRRTTGESRVTQVQLVTNAGKYGPRKDLIESLEVIVELTTGNHRQFKCNHAVSPSSGQLLFTDVNMPYFEPFVNYFYTKC